MKYPVSIIVAASLFLFATAAIAQPVPVGTVDINGDGVDDLGTWVGPCYFGTSDGTPTDNQLVACEYAASVAGGGNVFVIGTHGGIGTAQCLPPNGTVGLSGASQVMCSICYAGSQDPFGNSIAECVATTQAVACQDVIACTGSVSPQGMVPDGNGGMCAGFGCDGVWVDGCDPPNVITPQVPGLCFDYQVEQPVSNPIAGAVTVGCFAGDQGHDIWQRCRDQYADWVVENGTF